MPDRVARLDGGDPLGRHRAVWAPNERLEAFGIPFEAVAAHTDMGSIENLQPEPIGLVPGDDVDLLHHCGFTHAHARRPRRIHPSVGDVVEERHERSAQRGRAGQEL
jgi:hypothetical protein